MITMCWVKLSHWVVTAKLKKVLGTLAEISAALMR